LRREIQAKLDSIIKDEDWPSILAQRKINTVTAEERLAEMERERDAAREAGFGEWRNSSGTWLVSIEGHSVGDIVAVRRRNSTVSHHELTAQVSPMLFKAGKEIAEAELELRRSTERTKTYKVSLQEPGCRMSYAKKTVSALSATSGVLLPQEYLLQANHGIKPGKYGN
jgi:hypothetical protein